MPTTFNTTDPKPGYVYDTATDTWFPLLGIAPGSSIVRWRFTAVGAETSVSGLDDLSATLSYNAGTEQVYLNGVLLVRTADYTATTGTSVTGLTALAASDVIEVISFNATNVQITDALLETDINAKGDLIVGAAIDTAAILTSGTNGQVLSVNTATATGLAWITSDDANAIQNAIVDAKGDLLVGTADNTISRLAVGANTFTLVANSATATGLEWQAPAGGSAMVLTKAQSFSAASTVNVNDCFSTTYKNYLILINNTAIAGNFDLNFRLRVSSADNTTSNYNHWGAYFDGSATANVGAGSADKWEIGNSIGLGFYQMWIHAPFASEVTGFEALNGSTSRYRIKGGNFNANTSFTGFSLLPSSNDMTGTLRVYGLVDA